MAHADLPITPWKHRHYTSTPGWKPDCMCQEPAVSLETRSAYEGNGDSFAQAPPLAGRGSPAASGEIPDAKAVFGEG